MVRKLCNQFVLSTVYFSVRNVKLLTFSDEDDDDLFKSAVGPPVDQLLKTTVAKEPLDEKEEESGYDSSLVKTTLDQEVPR